MSIESDSEIYYSNDGLGPGVARIVKRLENGMLLMEMKTTPARLRWEKFQISEKALNSTACGWKKRKVSKE